MIPDQAGVTPDISGPSCAMYVAVTPLKELVVRPVAFVGMSLPPVLLLVPKIRRAWFAG